MTPIFLIGGGWRAETFSQTFGRFLNTATRNGQRKIAIVVAKEPDSDSQAQFLRFLQAFESIGLNSTEASKVIVSAENPLTKEQIAAVKPTGVFVCGGLTPAYFDGLCLDKSWLEFLLENNIPYGGFSAGAAIAAERAIIGGWRRKLDKQVIEITNENASEDLDFLDVREGLGLVPFAIDIHATQWGTISRLIHAVEADLAENGWAIDENTMLEIIDGQTTVHGIGNAYSVQRLPSGFIIIKVNKMLKLTPSTPPGGSD